MSHNQVRLLLSDVDGHSEWFKFRNINKWIQKLWKPSIIGMYVGKYEGEQSSKTNPLMLYFGLTEHLIEG